MENRDKVIPMEIAMVITFFACEDSLNGHSTSPHVYSMVDSEVIFPVFVTVHSNPTSLSVIGTFTFCPVLATSKILKSAPFYALRDKPIISVSVMLTVIYSKAPFVFDKSLSAQMWESGGSPNVVNSIFSEEFSSLTSPVKLRRSPILNSVASQTLIYKSL